MYSFQPRASVGVAPRSSAQSLSFLRRVYLLFSGSIAFAILGAMAALYAGTPTTVAIGRGAHVEVPPLVAFGLQHWFIMFLLYLGAFFAASFLRRARGINLVALFGYGLVTGLFIAPSLFFAQVLASQGHTLDASPIRDAFLLTGAAFTGLTTYTLVSRRDFSMLGAALNMGVWVLLGAMLLGFFVHAQVFQLAIASVGVLLFAGYILYDTSRIMRDGEDDAIGAALRLFLDVINLFLFLVQILSSSRDSR
jgi:modulator of FtsH protease